MDQQQQVYDDIVLKTDLARYPPGQPVLLSSDQNLNDLTIRYKHLDEVIGEEILSGNTWRWTPPPSDFRGYLVEIIQSHSGEETILGTVGVDVSSDWTRFPRYGFLSSFGNIPMDEITTVVENLKDFHINGLQFYDWHYKHHLPVKIENGQPAASWMDIIGRTNYRKTVVDYIHTARQKNIASMFYNLLYGMWDDFESDGASKEWLIYNDPNQQQINKHDLPSGWQSDILVTYPGNGAWQKYIFEKTQLIYDHYDFDGWHLDQLGDRGQVYNYHGQSISLVSSFKPFLQKLKATFPDKKMVLNAVNQFGQAQILDSEVDFAYSEVWSPNESYADLANIILKNNSLSDQQKNTVVAAYVNYELADHSGISNTAGILLADAVIFAFGGSHIELGEHLLAKEYFPNNNLKPDDELKIRLIEYYNFLVAYQNLLRDGGEFNNPGIKSTDENIQLKNWPPQNSTIAAVGKKWPDRQVIHLINFSDTNDLNWRDSRGNQTKPESKKNLKVTTQEDRLPNKIWFASPDDQGGSARELPFTMAGSELTLTIPTLQYWSMIVIEF